jgi:general nucleoside transport system permease protein
MEHYAGIDGSLEQSSVCVVDGTGRIVREARVASEPGALARFLGRLGLVVTRTGIEAGPLSQGLHAGLTQAGLEVVLLETRQVKAALSAMVVKTDRTAARGIAQLLRMGWYRPVHCVVNLGLEGTMLIGAVNGFAATQAFGSVWAGIAAALLAGALFGVAFAFLVVTLRLDQVVTGLAFTILGAGLSAFIGKPYVGTAPRATVPTPDLGPLGDLPFLGRVLFSQDILVYAALALTAAVAFYLKRTRPGLVLRALGESPDVLDSLGLPVAALRYAYVVTGTALAGLGGAYLSLAFTPSWIENMTAGRGWIAIALVIFATWRPWWVLGGAILFGAVDALRFRAQVGGDPIVDPHFLNMLPYVATLGVLALVSRSVVRRRLGVPAALGIAYHREQR